MSCICNVCYCTIRPPQTLWYAVTAHMVETRHLCSDCLQMIPRDARTATTEQAEFIPTFGTVRAEVSDTSGNYQSDGSRMLDPQFTVPWEVLAERFPRRNDLVDGLRRFARPADLLGWLVEAQREGTWAKWPGEHWPLRRVLTVEGALIECFLGLAPGGKPVRARLTGWDCEEPTPEQGRLADELWQEVLRRYPPPAG